jgi:ABC-type dipeptide/oligopeptide/nickel transport system permease subunit
MSTVAEADQVAGPGTLAEAGGRPLRADAWRRFRRNRLAMVGLVIISMLVLAALLAPWIAPSSITEQYRPARDSPSADHWFGTDRVGRDVFSRVVYGARVSLRIGFLATALSLSVGMVVGILAGFFGGLLDSLLMRLVDVVYAVPYVILAVALATVVGRSEGSITLILGLTGWIGIARVVRASFLSLSGLEYVEAARALGFSRWRIITRHMLPNALQPVIVIGTITVGTVILSEASLSFLNVGPQDPTPAWGLMVADGKGLLTTAPNVLLFPGAAIFLTVLAFVFVGDGLRDALDPKLK